MQPSFLQSKEWEIFQQQVGRKTWRIEGALVILHKLPAGFSYLYCPRPATVSERFFVGAEQIARRERAIFFKIDPIESVTCYPSPVTCHVSSSLQPRETAILGLQKSEDELLAAMHEKTRYNIRLAERKGVHIKKQESRVTAKEFEIFWMLLEETAMRDGFHLHQKDYYEKLLLRTSEDFSNELFIAEYQDVPVATALVNFYGPAQTATYLHGASSAVHRDAMAPHLLHWRVIQEARRRGFLRYDLWGIDEKKWPGITRFKMGFGGGVVEYPPSVDLIYQPTWYNMYQLIKNLKSKMQS